MRILSPPRTVASAEKIMEATLSAYFSPNKTMRELHDLMKSGAGAPTFPGTASLLVDARMLAA
jgi:hypothetical protein